MRTNEINKEEIEYLKQLEEEKYLGKRRNKNTHLIPKKKKRKK